MRKFHFYFFSLSVFAIFIFTSCSEDEPTNSAVKRFKTIDFENIVLVDSILKTSSFSTGSMTFNNYYNAGWGSWYSPESLLAAEDLIGAVPFSHPGETFHLRRSPVHARVRVNRSIMSYAEKGG